MGEPKPRTVRSPKRWVGFWWRAGVAYSRVGLAASWKQLAAERTTLPIGVMLLTYTNPTYLRFGVGGC